MPVRTSLIQALLAVQKDREAARNANDDEAFKLIFSELVTPLNRQLARMRLDPKADDEEIGLILATFDAGIARVGVARCTNGRDCADALRRASA